MEEIKLIRDKVSATLWQLQEETLLDVCRSLKCDGLDKREPGSMPHRLLIGKAEEVLDGMEIDCTDVEVKEVLNNVLIKMEQQDKRHWDTAERRLESESSPRHSTQAVKARTHEKHSSLSHPLPKSPEPLLRGPSHMLPEVTLRREFKICGQIGESG